VTWMMAVSAEWPGRKPDCSDGRRLADVRKCRSWRETRHLSSFDSTDSIHEIQRGSCKRATFIFRITDLNSSFTVAVIAELRRKMP